MKILVTGGLGFIGSTLIKLAVQKGHQVVNIDKISYAANLDNLAVLNGNENYAFYPIDIFDYDALENIFNESAPDAVFHLAAESHVDNSIKSPLGFIQSNIVGTFNLLEITRKYIAKNPNATFKFMHISTDEVFGSLKLGDQTKFSETSRYEPNSPYSASKASSDHLVRAWISTYKLPAVITNCSNNYGPFQHHEKLIPLVIKNALTGLPIPIYGTGQNVRDWLHVNDHVDALMTIFESERVCVSYNIGGGNEVSNLDLVNQICSILDELKPKASGSYRDLIKFVEDRAGHDERYAIDNTKLKNELGWLPKTDFSRGLRETVSWYAAI